MTREEEILRTPGDYHKSPMKCAAFVDGAEWADKHPKSPWINAKNELPAKGGLYLCMDENRNISTLAFNGDRWGTFLDVPLEVVTHWMPIPKLPNEQED